MACYTKLNNDFFIYTTNVKLLYLHTYTHIWYINAVIATLLGPVVQLGKELSCCILNVY